MKYRQQHHQLDQPDAMPLRRLPTLARHGLARLLIIPIFSLVGTWSSITAQEADSETAASSSDFQVIVNTANPTESMEASTVAKIFLKKVRRWDHDESITPIDLGPKDPVRKTFTKAVHGKSVTAIKSFWQRMIFSARGQPPEEKASAEDVVEFVRSTPGAIGYVAADTELGEDVKELKITP